ncbi:Golgi to ER traffic protein 4 [Ataeniobius toweri]|uniref:Golgi to ER traffic protein 4 n=1 Tax=Ataeniobius toweri TaxID=208326 RepID=A0ABU7AHV0_9TELE|nr:Golgi to ER traffic protein 4 [Ataeniobius toweri]
MAEPESLRCSSVRNRGGVQRVEGKLRASVEKGDYYEAHQMYRTLFFRYMSQGKHAEARQLMYNGALLFFSYNQQNSAADLSMLVLEVLEKSDTKVEDEILGELQIDQYTKDLTHRPVRFLCQAVCIFFTCCSFIA